MRMGVVFVSGVHGSGKSTLLRALLGQRADFVLGDEVALPALSSFFERQAGRHCRYFLHACSYTALSLAHPEQTIFGDRCCYDGLAYTRAYRTLGWVDDAYVARVRDLHAALFTSDHLPERVLFVNPPLAFVEKNLQKRWQETGSKKWREEDMSYLAAAHAAFRDVYATASCDVLDLQVMHPEERVAAVLDWLS